MHAMLSRQKRVLDLPDDRHVSPLLNPPVPFFPTPDDCDEVTSPRHLRRNGHQSQRSRLGLLGQLGRSGKILCRLHHHLDCCTLCRSGMAGPEPPLDSSQNPQSTTLHRCCQLPTRLSRQDMPRVHHQWQLLLRRRILDHEHLLALWHRPLSSLSCPVTECL